MNNCAKNCGVPPPRNFVKGKRELKTRVLKCGLGVEIAFYLFSIFNSLRPIKADRKQFENTQLTNSHPSSNPTVSKTQNFNDFSLYLSHRRGCSLHFKRRGTTNCSSSCCWMAAFCVTIHRVVPLARSWSGLVNIRSISLALKAWSVAYGIYGCGLGKWEPILLNMSMWPVVLPFANATRWQHVLKPK